MDPPTSSPKLKLREGLYFLSIFNSFVSGFKYRAEQIAKIVFLKNSSRIQVSFFFHSGSYSKHHKIALILFETLKVSSIHIGRDRHTVLIFPFPVVNGLQYERHSPVPKGWTSSTPVYSKTREIAKKTKQDPATKHLVSITGSGWISCFLILIKSFQKILYVSRSERNKGSIFTWQW